MQSDKVIQSDSVNLSKLNATKNSYRDIKMTPKSPRPDFTPRKCSELEQSIFGHKNF